MKYYPPRYLFRRYEIMKRVRGGPRFLEVGPGNLYLSQELLRYFQRGTLIEYNPEIKKLYQALPLESRNRLELRITDFQAERIEGQFDCVIACEVMEHVENDVEFFGKLIELLAPGGQLMLSVPAHMRYWSIHDEIVGHYRRYDREELRALIQRHEFRAVEIASYGFPYTNILRLPRVAIARWQAKTKREWKQRKQTEKSGLAGMQSTIARGLGLLINPVTAEPFCKVASLFNRLDWSNGYLVFARKL